MSYLFDYGEFLLCIAPVFVIIAAVGLILLANSVPSKKKKSGEANEEKGASK
jgi:hypothetical protein